MANTRFRRGSGVYTCNCCKKQTRDVNGDAVHCNLCAECYEVAGCENEVSDGHDGAQERLEEASELAWRVRGCESCRTTMKAGAR